MKKTIITGMFAVVLVTGIEISTPLAAKASSFSIKYEEKSENLLAKVPEYKNKIVEMELPANYLNKLKIATKKPDRLESLYKEIDDIYLEWKDESVSGELHEKLQVLFNKAQELLKETDQTGTEEKQLLKKVERAQMVLEKSYNEGEYLTILSDLNYGIKSVEEERTRRWTR